MRDVIPRIGRLGVVTLITLLAILVSVFVTILIREIFSLGLSPANVITSMIIPAIVSPIISWYFIGLLMELHHSEKMQRKLATYDMLTGLMTRRAFFEHCDSLMNLIERTDASICLAYIDLDNFKQINERYGHGGGDEVLKSFSSLILPSFRKSDLIGRIGGEEFAVALPDTDLENSIRILEQFRLAAKADSVVYLGHEISYTISIGITVCDGGNNARLDTLTQQADLALYNAKKSGKDRVIEHDENSSLYTLIRD